MSGYTLVTTGPTLNKKNCVACGSNAATCSATLSYSTTCSTGY